jgi:hypothetical protein
MDAKLFAVVQDGSGEFVLFEGFSTRQGHSSTAIYVKRDIYQDIIEYLPYGFSLSTRLQCTSITFPNTFCALDTNIPDVGMCS